VYGETEAALANAQKEFAKTGLSEADLLRKQ
jgi:hypothetical protein